MKNILAPVCFSLVLANSSFSQNLPAIQTDRPDQTECPFITPTNYIQFENGFIYEKSAEHPKKITAPTVLTKFGINDSFELRLITEFNIESNDFKTISGITPIAIGFKTKLLEEKGIIPTTSFIGHLHFPKIASPTYKANFYAPAFRFTMQHTLSNKQTLSYNLGAEWDGETAKTTFIYTLTTGYSFTEKMSAYIEFYGFIPQTESPDHRFDAGIVYLLNQNHQLDISSGIWQTQKSLNYFISFGYSFRFKI
jgi:hypothetical protein